MRGWRGRHEVKRCLLSIDLTCKHGGQVDDNETRRIGNLEQGIVSVVTPFPAMGHSHHHKHKQKRKQSFKQHQEDPEAGAREPDSEGDDA